MMKRFSASSSLIARRRMASATASPSLLVGTATRTFIAGDAGGSGANSPTFVNGLFKRSFNAREMFPYPATKADGAQRARLDTLLNAINDGEAQGMKTITGMSVPSERGGLQLSHTARAAVMETLGEGQLLSAIYSTLHTCTCANLISSFASGPQRDAYLPLIASGEATFAFAFMEMEHEVDVSMCATTADLDAASGQWTVNGTKALRGMNAVDTKANPITHFVVLAKTTTQTIDEATGNSIPATRSTLFIVKAGAGVAVSGSSVTFTKAPAAEVIGAVGEGFSGMMVSKHTVRYGHDAAIIGTAKGLYNKLLATPSVLSSQPDALAYVSALIYGMESAVYALTANIDNKSEDALIDAAFASITVHYAAQRILAAVEGIANTSTDMAAFGASSSSGLTSSTTSAADASGSVAAFRAQLSLLLTVGEPVESLQAIAACCGVEDFGIEFQKEGTLTTMGGRMARGLGAKQRLPLKVSWPEVAPIEDQFAAFGDAVEAVFVKCGPSLRYKQLSMERIAKAGAFLYASCASVSRAVKQDKKETGASERALCKILLPVLTADAGALLKEVNNSAIAPDDGLVRVVGEMVMNYCPIDPNSEELKAEDAIIAAKKKAEDEAKAAAEKKAAEEKAAAEKTQ